MEGSWRRAVTDKVDIRLDKEREKKREKKKRTEPKKVEEI
jgi:hypothetical protein